MSYDNLNKTTGLIHKNANFIGTSILFPWKGELYAITAGHNIYGKNFDQIPDLENWEIKDFENVNHPILAIIGNVQFASEHDIIIVKLCCKSSLANFVCPKFCTIPKNPKHSLLFRGKYSTSLSVVTHRKITFNTIFADASNKFLCDFDRSLLTNDSYVSGSDWLCGWSGSGLFIDNYRDLICAGIMCEIPNRGNDGQILFSSVCALQQLGFDVEILAATELDFDNSLNSASLNAILDEVDERAIKEWEINNKNSPQLAFLNRKLYEVYPALTFEMNKRKIIKQLLIGKSYLITELAKNEQLYNMYSIVYRVYDLESKQLYAASKKEALAGLTSIKKDYEEYLLRSIGKKFSSEDIKLLALYGVSEWIADCSLDFLSDE